MSLDIYLGPMFAGKSSAILSTVKRYTILHWTLCIITHSSDSRFSSDNTLMNHDLASVPCQKWSSLLDHLDDPIVQNAQLVILDEAQFFPDLYEFVRILVDIQKKKVLVVGLDGDIHRKPFGSILQCIPLADSITKLKAFCSLCGDGTEAIFSHRKKEIVSTEQIFVGGAEAYMPLCRKHYLEKETN